MQIGRKDIMWNYAATFFKIASSILLFPFILKMMPSQTVGIWNIFITITSFVALLDFGFNPSFTRNITYVFSGVRILKSKGFVAVNKMDNYIDYGLLKGLIIAMRWFYFRVAAILFILLVTLGTFYIHIVIETYNGNHSDIYISWILLIAINTYNLYTLYYDSLLLGKGLIKRSKQIAIAGQIVYLVVAAVLIIFRFNLISIVSAQVLSVIIVRVLSYRAFFTKELIQILKNTVPRSQTEILGAIYPNALKIGLTSLGGFMVQKSAIIIGSLYLSLEEIASYGVTMQLIAIITGLAGIYYTTYLPKISQLRVLNNNTDIKEIYLKTIFFSILTYTLGGAGLILLGDFTMNLIKSQTQLMPMLIILVMTIITLLENNHAIAGGILLTNNEVPFFKASLLAGVITILLLFFMFNFTKLELWAMILAPGIAHLYNNWKWPYEVYIQLNISKKDIMRTFFSLINSYKYGK